MGIQGPKTAEWFGRGKEALVNGVSSGFRYWGDDDTLVIDRGEGAYVYDMDGNRYIDYQLGFGPIILGHGHKPVADAVAEAAARGTVFAMTTALEIEAALAMRNAIPWLDALRFTNTGTEATMHAIRLARAVTGRDLIVKFEGAYHGAHDYVGYSTAGAPLGNLGNRRSPVPFEVSSGVPSTIRDYIRIAHFNDLEFMEKLFKSDGHRIAGILVEPALGNVFGLMPDDGYMEGLRAITEEWGSMLMFDEVKTGFRLGLGGAAEYLDIVPDIGMYAKSMGNGFPIAAVGGRTEIMSAWAEGGVMQAGTYSGNSVGAAATVATIAELSTGAPYEKITKTGEALMAGLEKILAEQSMDASIIGHPSMFSIFLGEGELKNYRDTGRHDEDLYSEIIFGMIRRGVMPVDDAKEPWFISSAHSDEDVAETLTAFEEALVEAKA
ncbi:MAG: aspartate aminotransferase family protein [Actinomycetota bacterium]|nr:aspartate aminotransferase family protein [Actinomycetota bacterium]